MSKLAKTLQAAAGNAGGDNLYVEDVFSTYLYTGNGSTQTITNGIDLAGEGGLVWTKMRNTGAFGNSDHWLFDTARGVEKKLSTNTTGGQGSTSGALEQFNSDGYQLGYAGGGYYELNYTGNTYASWSFRKSPKFFDVVTYTGDGTSGRAVAHNLGSVPGFMIVKVTSEANNWTCWHRSITGQILELNTTAAQANDSGGGYFYSSPDATNIYLGSDWQVNKTDETYVAYVFAHDAGGFGDDGLQNVISCGSVVTGNVSTDVVVNLGYEPQWILMKRTDSTSQWFLVDVMRKWIEGSSFQANALYANLNNAEGANTNFVKPTATGFTVTGDNLGDAATWVYIAIRRGPMKTPTDATKVFSPIARNGTAGVATVATTNLPDSIWSMNRSGGTGYPAFFYDRLRGANTFLIDNTSAETYDAANSGRYSVTAFDNLSYALGADVNYAGINGLTSGYSNWVMSRAPGFFDVVAYSGDSASSRNIAHNLSASPELIMLATRTTTNLWPTYHKDLPDPNPTYPSFLRLNTNGGINSSGGYYAATPTESVFTIGGDLNASDQSYIAYLFATLPGVSKVGSYTGTGADLNVDCGFSAGARFILIKRTDSTGDWYVWDSLRGIVSGNDPYLLLNSPAAEEPNTDYIDPLSSGFTVTSSAPAALNASNGTYLFLAIA
jgi:hypothetical protein